MRFPWNVVLYKKSPHSADKH